MTCSFGMNNWSVMEPSSCFAGLSYRSDWELASISHREISGGEETLQFTTCLYATEGTTRDLEALSADEIAEILLKDWRLTVIKRCEGGHPCGTPAG